MQISNFEYTGDLSLTNDFLMNYPDLDKETMLELLKTVNISFILEGINRLQSMLICELKNSYVQQSQRYVTLSADGYTLPKLHEADEMRAHELIGKAFSLYEEMTVLKDDFKGRPKKEHYVHGIPIEDARYILPLAVKTNITVSMTGDKLYDWFNLFHHPEHRAVFSEIQSALLELLPNELGTWFSNQKYYYPNEALTSKVYRSDFNKITSETPVVLLHAFKDADIKVGLGAVTSTKDTYPSEVLKEWGDDAQDKAKSVMDRVLGYGHTAIQEQHRTTFGMMFSLVTYHQNERHRLPSTYRESLQNILLDANRPVIIPKSICAGGFRDKYMHLVNEFKAFQQYLAKHYEEGIWRYFLINCQQIKIITSTNARIDSEMLKERICNNAQWEIHDISCMKLDLLRKQSEALYKNAVPPCVYGACKEGKMTCGKAVEMREKYLP